MATSKEQPIPREIEKEVSARATKMAYEKLGIPEGKQVMGLCHTIWACKKQILKDEHGIDWQSPDDLHPDWCID